MTEEKETFPNWLSPKAKAVAEALIADGFCYCGLADDFVVESLEVCGDWQIGGIYQEIGLDALFQGALFFKEYDFFDSETLDDEDEQKALGNKELERIKQLITQTESAWSPL